jgi:hypothetical protein
MQFESGDEREKMAMVPATERLLRKTTVQSGSRASAAWKKFREKVAFGVNRSYRPLLYSEKGREMADQDKAGLAFERAWNVYLLINSDVDENDERRAIVERYIRQRCEAGESDTETLTVEGLTYLKKLDELGQYSLR